MPGVASSSPAVLTAHLAAHTTHIRLGSGGVMLPNHAPLVSPSSSGRWRRCTRAASTSASAARPAPTGHGALRCAAAADPSPTTTSPRQLAELSPLPRRRLPARATRTPRIHGGARRAATSPAIWLLGSSGYSAQLAGSSACPSPSPTTSAARNTRPALRALPRAFRPSAHARRPVRDGRRRRGLRRRPTSAPAAWPAPGRSRWPALAHRAARRPCPSPRRPPAHDYSPARGDAVEPLGRLAPWSADPETSARGLEDLAARTGADELMLTTNVYDHGRPHPLLRARRGARRPGGRAGRVLAAAGSKRSARPPPRASADGVGVDVARRWSPATSGPSCGTASSARRGSACRGAAARRAPCRTRPPPRRPSFGRSAANMYSARQPSRVTVPGQVGLGDHAGDARARSARRARSSARTPRRSAPRSSVARAAASESALPASVPPTPPTSAASQIVVSSTRSRPRRVIP